MNLKKRDWLFVLLIVTVLGVFYALTGEETTTRVPRDAVHQPFHDLRAEGKKKIEIDARCADCHDGVQIAFPADHPAKPGGGPMRCLFCHKLESK